LYLPTNTLVSAAWTAEIGEYSNEFNEGEVNPNPNATTHPENADDLNLIENASTGVDARTTKQTKMLSDENMVDLEMFKE
jgi:hypothetical protein